MKDYYLLKEAEKGTAKAIKCKLKKEG